jgi:hypothetical protein
MQGLDSGLIRIEDESGGDRTVMVYATEQQAKAAFELKNQRATPGMFELQGCRILAALSSTAAAKVSVLP